MTGFGEQFRTARELRGLELAQIAQETRISARFLRAIENEAFEELPGGLFNRGFVRTYAEAVGLDPTAMVEAYSTLTETAETEESEAPAAPQRPAGRERYVLPVALGGLVVVALVFYAGWRNSGTEEIPVPSSVSTAPPPRPIAPPPAPEPQPVAEVTEGGAPVTEEALAASEAEEPIDETAVEAAEIATAPPALIDPDPVTETPAAAATTLATVGNSARTEPVDVRVELLDRSWMYIELDGEIQYENVINPPFWRNYTVTEALELRIGNPAAAALSVNGEPVTRPALSDSDEMWSLTITPENASNLAGSL